MFDVSILGINLWLWAALIGLAIVLYPAAMLVTKLVALGLRSFIASCRSVRATVQRSDYAADLDSNGEKRRDLPGIVHRARRAESSQDRPVIGLAWLFMRVIDFMAQRAGSNLERKGLAGSRVLLMPVARLVKFIALAGAVLLWMDNAGYKVTTLLAGLSISGVAVALASQKSLENIFGAVTLFTSPTGEGRRLLSLRQ